MVYKMRFVQTFDKGASKRFLELERNFIELEKRTPGMKCGRRFVSVTGREPTNTMVWEADYDTLEAAVEALQAIEGNTEHDKLLDEQARYMRDAYVEIYRELE